MGENDIICCINETFYDTQKTTLTVNAKREMLRQ